LAHSASNPGGRSEVVPTALASFSMADRPQRSAGKTPGREGGVGEFSIAESSLTHRRGCGLVPLISGTDRRKLLQSRLAWTRRLVTTAASQASATTATRESGRSLELAAASALSCRRRASNDETAFDHQGAAGGRSAPVVLHCPLGCLGSGNSAMAGASRRAAN